MSFDVVYTSNFEREVKRLARRYPSLKKDLEELIKKLEEDPSHGTPLGKGCYKIRLAVTSKGKGKSGGARVITHVYVVKGVVYLLSIYDKSTKETISDKEIVSLIKLIE
jgi:mRNA-degrading endonuclease RelE of RelBE toxin-antitoxin system